MRSSNPGLLRVVPALALAAVTLLSTPAVAHILLESPAPRYVYTVDGQKTPMCGTGALTGDVTWYQPGETITVEWTETINHPGYFRISVDPDGGDDDLVDPTDYNDLYVAPSVLLDDIQDGGGSMFSAQVTLPNVECDVCTLQLIQVMTDKPPWGPAGGNDIYYWCADIRISTTPPGGGGAGGVGGAGNGGSGGAPAGGAGGAPGTGGGGDAGGGAEGGAAGGGGAGGQSGGCGCIVGGAPSGHGAWLLGALVAGLVLRRRSASLTSGRGSPAGRRSGRTLGTRSECGPAWR